MNDKKNDFDGFEDIIDLLIEEEGKGKKKDLLKSRKDKNDTYDLYNFLDNEKKRLEKLVNLFETKVDNIVRYDQTDKLIEKQEEVRQNKKSELIKLLKEEDSPLMSELARIYGSLFK